MAFSCKWCRRPKKECHMLAGQIPDKPGEWDYHNLSEYKVHGCTDCRMQGKTTHPMDTKEERKDNAKKNSHQTLP